jgi:hypothetical protein
LSASAATASHRTRRWFRWHNQRYQPGLKFSTADWSLSDVTNVADNVVTAADTIVVEVVRVIDVAANRPRTDQI